MAKDEVKDTLDSTQTAYVLDLLCEGEIEGLKRASKSVYLDGTAEWKAEMLKDIYLNGTPVLKQSADVTNISDSEYNFRNVKFRFREGTENQNNIEYFNTIQREIGVGVAVTKDGGPVTRRITDIEVTSVRFTLTWPALYKVGSQGVYKPQSVNFKLQVNYGVQWETIQDVTLEGLSLDQYQKDYRIKLDPARFGDPGDFVDIRVRRVTDDNDDESTRTSFSWTSYTETIKARLNYPFSALMGLEFQAKDFSNVPQRSYFVRGLKILVPSNATVKPNSGRIEYTGVWDGTFKAQKEWTADPAWILYDLITASRYGTGDLVDVSNLDKFAFYSASQYCNELVPSMDPDDEDDTEPRFSCNVVLQTFESAYDAISNLASIFRAMPYWGLGTIRISQDRPLISNHIFNLSNVSEEGFSYSGTSEKTRHSVAIVKWFRNKIQNYEYEVVEDSQAYAILGYKPITIDAIGVRTRGQARRVGEWLLYTDNNDTEVVSFTTTLEILGGVNPGDLITIQDPMRDGVRRGGRIVSFTSNTVDIDEAAATDLPLGGNPSIQFNDVNGTRNTYTVTNVSGSTITVSGTISPDPVIGGAFVYNDNTFSSKEWKVLSIEEKDLASYVVNAAQYNASKYDYIERDRPLVDQDYLPINSGTSLNGVGVITAVVQNVTYQGIPSTEVLINWQSDPNAVSYVINIAETSTTATVGGTFYQILPAVFDTYNVSVFSVNANGSQSPSSFALIEVNNILNAPADPIDLTVVQQDVTNALLTFTASSDSSVTSGGFVVVRHSPLLTGATWESATELAQVAGSSSSAIVPLLTGTYFIKFLNSSGFYSTNSASDTLTAEEIAPELPIETIEEEAP